MVLSIGYFERYVNSKTDYIDFLLSVYIFVAHSHFSYKQNNNLVLKHLHFVE